MKKFLLLSFVALFGAASLRAEATRANYVERVETCLAILQDIAEGPNRPSPNAWASAKAVLIRGPSGAGKSRLAWQLISAAPSQIPFARLVADDRVFVAASNGRLLARPAPELAGLLEIRGLGIRRLAYEPVATVGLVVDLAASDADRLPAREAMATAVAGITLPRLAVAPSHAALPAILAILHTATTGD